MRRTSTLVEDQPADRTGALRVGGEPARPAPIGRRRYWQVRSTAVVVLKLVIAVAIGLLFFLPLIWLISSALKTNTQEFAVPPTVIPRPVDWQNFSQVFTIVPFGTFYLNTTIIAVATVVGSVLSNTLVAYGFTKIQWPGRNALFGVALATLMIPYLVILVPQYVLFYHFGWINTFLPLIVPAFGANPFYIFMLRQFLRTIPEELSDAARVDGRARATDHGLHHPAADQSSRRDRGCLLVLCCVERLYWATYLPRLREQVHPRVRAQPVRIGVLTFVGATYGGSCTNDAPGGHPVHSLPAGVLAGCEIVRLDEGLSTRTM